MIIGIDASNIRSAGGIAHLSEILRRINPTIHRFSKIIVWSSKPTLELLPTQDWLIKESPTFLNKTLFHSTFWKLFKRDHIVKKSGCNVLFLDDATFSRFHPSITICHNILPFSKDAIANFIFKDRIKLRLMRLNALASFKSSDKTIMLSNNSAEVIAYYYKKISSKTVIIPHGFDKVFENINSRVIIETSKVYKLIYISPLSPYKMQWKVIAAIHILLDQGYKVELTLVGKELNRSKKLIDKAISKRPEYTSKIKYKGEVVNHELPKLLSESDIFVFASLCETFGITLLEAMATGIPIACSNRSAMPEILKNAGVYFDPTDGLDIARAVKEIIDNPKSSELRSKQSIELSKEYSWEKCANTTFELLVKTGLKSN